MATVHQPLDLRPFGIRVEFLRTGEETAGELLEMEVSGRPRGFFSQRHVHPLHTRLSSYVFVDEWDVAAPPEAVFDALADVRSYPVWWRPVYLEVAADGPAQLGSESHQHFKGRLPITCIRPRWSPSSTPRVASPPRTRVTCAAGGVDPPSNGGRNSRPLLIGRFMPTQAVADPDPSPAAANPVESQLGDPGCDTRTWALRARSRAQPA